MHQPTPEPVVLNNERSRWRKQKNGLPQGSVISPVLFNIYTKPIYPGTQSFIYADDICVTAQYPSFTEVEETIEDALEEITQYYKSNSLRANPDKTQVTAFHIRIKEVKRSLKVKWSNIELDNTDQPKNLCVILDRTLSYKQHIQNTKMKVPTRNNRLLYVITLLNMQHQSGRNLITLTYWIENSTLHAEQ